MKVGIQRWRWIVFAFLLFAIASGSISLWFSGFRLVTHDPTFNGKLESEWIKSLKYLDDEQAKEWRGYGEEGIDVLIRGLESAKRPGERAYRKLYRSLRGLSGWLPDPKQDESTVRHHIIALLSEIGEDSARVVPAMIRTALTDESEGIRTSAIGYFITSNGDDTLANKLDVTEKRALLPALMSAVDNKESGALNSVILLKFYHEEADLVVPVLQKALSNSEPSLRSHAAEALNRLSPIVANEVGATEVLIEVANHPDDQIAYSAVNALSRATNRVELAVPALLKLLDSTNTLIACEAVWALDRASNEFMSYSDAITNALSKAAEREDSAGRYARAALKGWQP